MATSQTGLVEVVMRREIRNPLHDWKEIKASKLREIQALLSYTSEVFEARSNMVAFCHLDGGQMLRVRRHFAIGDINTRISKPKEILVTGSFECASIILYTECTNKAFCLGLLQVLGEKAEVQERLSIEEP